MHIEEEKSGELIVLHKVLGPQEIEEIESDEEEGTTITHISRARDSEALNMFVKF